MRIPKKYSARLKNKRPKASATAEHWEKKYTSLAGVYPFAVAELSADILILHQKEAREILDVKPSTRQLSLEQIFSDARQIIDHPKKKTYQLALLKSGKTVILNEILRFSIEERLFQLYDSLTPPGLNQMAVGTSNNPFQNLIEQSTDGICLLNEQGYIVEWNSTMSELYEVDREKYLNKPVWEFDYDYLPSNRKTSKEKKRIREIVRAYLNSKDKTTFFGEFEKEVRGKTKYIQYRIFPFRTAGGIFYGRINTDITQRKYNEQKLEQYKTQLEELYKNRTLDWQQSETRLHLLVQSVPIAFYSFEKSDRSTIWYSEQIEPISGFSRQELERDPQLWVSRINRSDHEILGGMFDRMKPNERVACEYRWLDAKGREIWIFDQAVLIEATESHPAQIVGCFMDISERKQAEISIMESERNYREIFNSSNDAILIQNAKTGAIEDVNETMLGMFNTRYSKALNSDFSLYSEGSPPYDQENLRKKINEALIKEHIEFEWLAKKENTTLFWVEIAFKTIILNSEAKIMAVIRDIDQKKKTEEQLRINEEKYRMLIEGQTDFIFKTDAEGRFLFASPSYCDLFSKTEEELLGKTFHPLIHKNDMESTETALERLSRPPYTCYVEHRTHTKNGWRWISWNYKAILNADKKMTEIMAVGRDMTYQKGVEEALRISEDRFRSIVQRLSDIILICDRESYIIYDTPTVSSILGYHEGTLVGQKMLDIIAPEDLDLAKEKLTELIRNEGSHVKAEVKIRNAEGKYIPMEGNAINLLNHHAIKGLVVTLRDVSERKMLDKKILDAVIKTEEQERERFAKNLHDDLGPLLSSIKMYVSSFSSATDPEKQAYIISQLNEVVKEAITTAKEVSNDLSPHILSNYGLIAAIENFIKKIPAGIKVNLSASLPSDRYSNTIENSFYRIVKELINNSLKHAHASYIDINLEESGRELKLSYTDNGQGMNMEKLNPAKNKGMGISNIISRSKSLNGKYQFLSKKGEGFTFKITIPIDQALD